MITAYPWFSLASLLVRPYGWLVVNWSTQHERADLFDIPSLFSPAGGDRAGGRD